MRYNLTNTILIVFLIIFISCNDSQSNVEKSDNGKVDKTSAFLKEDALKTQAQYLNYYKNFVERNRNDSLKIREVNSINFKISKADKYIDSIVEVLNKLHGAEGANVNEVKYLLADGKEGDTLFFLLNDVFSSIPKVISYPEQRYIADSIGNNAMRSTNSSQNWQQELFSVTNSAAAIYMLLALKNEIFKDGIYTVKVPNEP